MMLPNSDRAEVAFEKVAHYLLSTAHPVGRHKARFFLSHGFTPNGWTVLVQALLRHAAEYEVARAEATPFGTRYVVEGIMAAPDGRGPRVRSVWFIDTGADVPRFVTAYPLEAEA